MTTEMGQSLGEFLRQEREKRGVTIEQVASATKIAVRLLHLLEADQYSEMPAKPFVRGFVISYARFIGLDSKAVLTQYNDFIEAKAHDRPTRDQGHSGYAFERKESEQSRLILSVVLGSFIVIGGALFFVLKPNLHKRHRSHETLVAARAQASPVPSQSLTPVQAEVAVTPSPSTMTTAESQFVPPETPIVLINPKAQYVAPAPSPSEPVEEVAVSVTVAQVASPSPSPAPAPAPVASPSAAPTTSPEDPLNSGMDLKKEDIRYKVVFRALEDVWVRYQSDNRKPMRFPLRKDKVLVLRAKELLRFQASDPKLIRFQYLGAPKVLVEEKSAVIKGGDLTLVIPVQGSEKIKEPFPGAKTIFMMPVPPSAGPKEAPSVVP